MRKVYISTYTRSQVILLPVPPEVFQSNSSNNEVFKAGDGELNLPGIKGLKQITLKGFFPAYQYPFVQSSTYTPNGLVEVLEGFQSKQEPNPLVIPEGNLNLPVLIDSFEYEKQANKDIEYTLKVSEFRIPGV